MKLPLRRNTPIVVPRVRFVGPKAARRIDLLLDTGARSTLISQELARELGLDPLAAPLRIHVVTANGVIALPVVHVPFVELAGCRLRNVQVLCHNIPEMVEADGLLGLNLLASFCTTLDYLRKSLRIEAPPLRGISARGV